MTKSFFFALLLVMLPLQAIAAAPSKGIIQITIAYGWLSPGHIQVRDELCRVPRDIECEKARIKATGDSCRQEPTRARCKEAVALMESTLCVEGLVYDGRLTQGEEVQVRVCASQAGNGNVSVRNITNGGIWTNYQMVRDGRRINFQ